MTSADEETAADTATACRFSESTVSAVSLAPPTSRREPFGAPRMKAGPSSGAASVAVKLPATSAVEALASKVTPCRP